MNFSDRFVELRNLANTCLEGMFQDNVPWKALYEAMSYSVIAGGKRVRPILTMAFCESSLGNPERALPFGCAVELLHTYSLIHDDLPCMDNDNMRRGKESNHVKFGEGAALLAGDALQSAAFELILSAPLPPSICASAALELARAAGPNGMCAGQQMDINGVDRSLTISELEQIHKKKTGALLECACVLGVLVAEGTDEQCSAARDFAGELGMAYQIRDDLLDHISTTEALGKNIESDRQNKKTTFYTLLGDKGCEAEIEVHTHRAKEIVSATFPRSEFLCGMADYLSERMN